MWANTYEETLEEWIALRNKCKDLETEKALEEINNWVQQVPTVPHYLHLDDYKVWPGPWELLADNNFCEVAKSLLIVYTIIILNRQEINSLSILQSNNYTYVKVLTDTEYILNNQIGSIVSAIDTEIIQTLDCSYFQNKI